MVSSETKILFLIFIVLIINTCCNTIDLEKLEDKLHGIQVMVEAIEGRM